MKDRSELTILFKKFQKQECSPEEIERLSAYFRDEKNEKILRQIILQDLRRSEGEPSELPSSDVFERIEQQIKETAPSEKGRRSFTFLKIAAGLLMAISLFYLWYNTSTRQDTPEPLAAQSQVLQPGGNKAILHIEAGERVELNSIADGETVQYAGVVLSKLSEGRIKLDYDRVLASASDFQPPRHTITTPRGGQYEVTLADGTRVWLNAESSLTFPTAFNGPERRVNLQGEAYFEVTHNAKHPFFVQTENNEIEVLGTHFNIMEYPDQSFNHTTLVEGAVRFTHGQDKRQLRPGQQAQVSNNENAAIRIAQVDLERVLAWKNGIFMFKKTPLSQVMQDVARWYNAEVIYEEPIPEIRFSGMIPRNESIETLLKTLELTGGIQFKVQENKIMVKPKKKRI